MRLALVVLLVGCRYHFDDVLVDGAQDDGAQDPGIVEISLRGAAVCARSGDGRLACWGSNARGQLGRGTTSDTGEPQLVPIDDVIKVTTGEFETYAIDRDGVLWGMGTNEEGQLGIGVVGDPVPTPQRIEIPERVVDVAAGQYGACAISESRSLYCWGDNTCGSVGNGNTTRQPAPIKVTAVSDVAHVAVHDSNTCVSDRDGNVRCFGSAYNDPGCLGQNLIPTAPLGLPPVSELQGGCHMAMCAVDRSGGAWCWGASVDGSLGEGTDTSHVDPMPVAGITNAAKIGSGYAQSCASTSTNTVLCWGSNVVGGLGIGSPGITVSATPLVVPFFEGLPIDQIEVGCSTTCARSGHDIYCWGDNTSNVIDTTGLDVFAPRRIVGLPF